MIASDVLKGKLIVVAEHNEVSAQKIVSTLKATGFTEIRVAENGEQIYEILKPYADQPDTIGLIVLNAALPLCHVREMCQSLSSANSISVIPVVILNDDCFSCELDRCQPQQDNCLTYKINTPVNTQELILAVKFLLSLKQERQLRHRQEEQLINELAAKNVIDAKLKFLVAHDELTGLFNRSSFERQLRLVLNHSNKAQKDGSLLFIDVDRFSLINELEGFEVGDRLLVEMAILVRKLLPAGSLFARIGADEFCLFLENKTKKQAQILAETIKTTVDNFRFFTGEVSYSASVSIGIATLDNTVSAFHPGEMILHARQACNFAKSTGRDKICIYNSEDLTVKERRRDIYWVPIIRKALRDNQLFLVFQPVVQLSDGNVSHYEVLLRMRGEGNEIITPDQFIPVAERTGLIHAIDLWVVENAIDFLAALPTYMSYISLAVNLSSTAFQYPDLLSTIKDKLEMTWIDANRLTFEITETAAVDNFEKTRHMINKIRALGCKFALDDFGAGFCSFNYLKTFPVDYVKIDGQFIRNLLDNETDQILVKSMVEIASKLGKKTIAEFVESAGTAMKLKEIGVNFGQGYAFGKPEQNLLEGHKVSLGLLLGSNQAASLIT
ncbi:MULTISPECIES: GGDEF and EAL domain-containing protein [Methylomonas]|uniref:Diguanylate cyclase n=2 Tax=Methylomonas TaxID=416 RepID=A0A126T6H4_9GAMM|nr:MULTISPECIES: GGDEF and EAL domain-containing protein [Methylomonas]AMK77685.1 diguanylate cyclase [Methylomonas denitrificans]OAH96823.1 diguanylate cyclase [Methylomonas methanica]TCV86859.1 diguanylate cyclase (GGDEF)-like protein [Methylomonas methanica]